MATLDTRALAPRLAAMRLNREIATEFGVTEDDVCQRLRDLARQHGVTRKIDLCRLARKGALQ